MPTVEISADWHIALTYLDPKLSILNAGFSNTPTILVLRQLDYMFLAVLQVNVQVWTFSKFLSPGYLSNLTIVIMLILKA